MSELNLDVFVGGGSGHVTLKFDQALESDQIEGIRPLTPEEVGIRPRGIFYDNMVSFPTAEGTEILIDRRVFKEFSPCPGDAPETLEWYLTRITWGLGNIAYSLFEEV